MELTFEQECPQCGGLVELRESEHLLPCPFCGTKSFLVPKGFPRFILPPRPEAENLVYIPYLRFKGVAYDCLGDQLSYKILDLTRKTVPLTFLPNSLGVRPQALKMKFASPDYEGKFLKVDINIKEVIERLMPKPKGSPERKLFHRSYIGETISIVYFPLIHGEDGFYDGLTGDFVADLLPESGSFDSLAEQMVAWKPDFISTLCPGCGWDLEGERSSIILGCRNCCSFWEATPDGFEKVEHTTIPSPDNNSVYMAFWKISVKDEPAGFFSFADLLRKTNQPRLPVEEDEELPLSFLVPAFKIKPKSFLKMGSQLTILQKMFCGESNYPELPFHRIDLPGDEAVQSLKTILSSIAANKKELIPKLPEISFKVTGKKLMLLPFSVAGYGYFQKMASINLNKQDIRYGKFL